MTSARTNGNVVSRRDVRLLIIHQTALLERARVLPLFDFIRPLFKEQMFTKQRYVFFEYARQQNLIYIHSKCGWAVDCNTVAYVLPSCVPQFANPISPAAANKIIRNNQCNAATQLLVAPSNMGSGISLG